VVFKTTAIDHSAIPPHRNVARLAAVRWPIAARSSPGVTQA